MSDPITKEQQARAAINQRLIESGEKERLKEFLRNKLVETGWKDQMKTHCREVIKRKGLDNVTAEELVQEITPIAESQIPESVTEELKKKLRDFLTMYSVSGNNTNEPKNLV
eukprot:TRINITY_DN5101_c0_g7_i1.p1 TRINITY_DN5101_c0_g7~~TRINITY_DN5101_c0_g7_i1.p1  ORF type:complete len:112 (-),score=40.31 TRINITY_DN5101_c0_g7_i1:215-550(-)